MQINQLKKVIYERIKLYWSGATVVWGMTDKVMPPAPLIVLRLGTVSRTSTPIIQSIDSIQFSAYPSEVTLQIDLFTRGNAVGDGNEIYYENTATNDMLDFLNFLDSASSIEWSDSFDISISMNSGVQDLTEIVNDSRWQYRAMLEIKIAFTQWVAEYNGILNEDYIIFDDKCTPVTVDTSKYKQTASGGGTEELASATVGIIDELVIDFKNEGGI